MVVEDGSYIIFHHIYGTRVTIELLHMVILFFTFPKMFIDEIIVNPNRFWNFLKWARKMEVLHYTELLLFIITIFWRKRRMDYYHQLHRGFQL